MVHASSVRLGVPYGALLLLLFAFGINVPQLSQIVVYVLVLPLILRWNGYAKWDFLVPLLLLAGFCATYYAALYSWGFIELAQAVHRPLMFLGFYAIGYRAARAEVPNWPYGLIWLLLAIIAGFVAFAFLCTISTPVLETLRTREVGDFWRTGQPILVTGVGLFASLGLSLLPVAIFGTASSMRDPLHMLRAIVMAGLFALALYATSLFQNRSALIALMISAFTAFAMFLSKKGSRRTQKILVLLAVVGIAVIIDANFDRILTARLFTRLDSRGLSTPRYAAWLDVINQLPSHLVGGRGISVGGLEYAHNIWLDVARDAGILPLLFLAAFHIHHVRDFYRVATSRIPLPVALTFVCVAISFFVGFMVEPALQSSAPYFAGSCFFLGMTRRLSWDVRHLGLWPSSGPQAARFRVEG